jgi:hypothetical protein
MKTVSINRWPGQGGMVQVAGSDFVARAAIKVLKEHDCEVTGWTVSGSKGERIYTYKVSPEAWPEVSRRLRNIDEELQIPLF